MAALRKHTADTAALKINMILCQTRGSSFWPEGDGRGMLLEWTERDIGSVGDILSFSGNVGHPLKLALSSCTNPDNK